MRINTPPPLRLALLAPRYWLSWIGLGAIWLIARLPYRALLVLGNMLGWCAAGVMHARRKIARRNLAACFASLSISERERLLRATMHDLGMLLVEFALAWMGSPRAIARIPCRIDGLEHLEAAHANGKGVLLIGAHFSHLELCARLLSQRCRIAGMYRVMDDAVFEWAVLRARLGYADAMFAKEDIRACVKYLKHGGALWYAPDQDMRGKDSVFVPFFGVPAATITATHHLARLSGAVVIPFFHKRRPDGGYALRLEAPLDNFPSADMMADTACVNALIERMVQEAPEQYLWIHKRFKSRPTGTSPIY